MIRVKFLIGNNRITGFEISGHAMFAQSGSDIVCAAVSSAAYLASNTITDVIRADADASVKGDEFRLAMKSDNENAQAVLKGLELHLTELSKQFPQNIKIIYGGVKNA